MMASECGPGRAAAGVLASVLLLGSLKAAEAQVETPKFQVSGGYAFLHDLGDEGQSLPLGWDASVAANLTDSFGVVGDLGGNYKSEAGVSFNVHSFLGGVRYSFRREGLTPYVEGLAGMVRGGASSGGVSASSWDFGVQAGGGLNYRVKDNLSLRGGVDFRNIFIEGGSSQQFRLVVGVTFGLGGPREAAASPVPISTAPPLPSPPTREPAPIPPPVSPPPPEITPARPQAPAVPEPARPRPALPTKPEAAPPSAPQSFAAGRDLLKAGLYAQASDAFRAHLQFQAPNKFTVAIGLFCEEPNLGQLVRNSGDGEQLFVLSVPRAGRVCYGLYWGLFSSRSEARQALESLPTPLRTRGQTPISVSRILP